MADEQVVRLLEEIRDLQKQHMENYKAGSGEPAAGTRDSKASTAPRQSINAGDWSSNHHHHCSAHFWLGTELVHALSAAPVTFTGFLISLHLCCN
jgi:hypothetical protein